MYQSVPNQKAIVGWHRNPANKEEPYTLVTNESAHAAAKDLHPTTFILWYALCTESNATTDPNKQRHIFWLSQKAIENQWGLSRPTYYRAIDELKEKGYLVSNENNYIFYETPQKSE